MWFCEITFISVYLYRLDWIPNLKKNFSFFLLHLRIIGNFFKFFSILNPRTKQLSENYFSWTLYLKQSLPSDDRSQLKFIYLSKKKESIHITMMFVPKLFQSSLLFAKQFTIPPPRFISSCCWPFHWGKRFLTKGTKERDEKREGGGQK